ncbi:MAG: Gfo/Idh/MocA family protein [Opitutales bacterium]
MSDLRFAIIGIGNMGTAHAKSLQEGKVPGATLTAICDSLPEKLERVNGVEKFADPQQLLEAKVADAIVIATPHYDHTTLGIEALQAGYHVLVEKPISVHKADCERLLAAHTNPKQVFAAMFNQRTDPRYQKLRALIQNGDLGTINRIQWTITDWFRTAHYYASGGWRATWQGEGGGVLLNQCPHQLDLFQWLFGMPQRVRAFCHYGKFHEIEVEDDVTAYLEYASGCTGVFITTTGEAPGTNRLEIAAENGKVIVEGDTFAWTRNQVPTAQHSASEPSSFSKPETERLNVEVSGKAEQHVGIFKNFVAAIQGEAELLAPAAEGTHSVELANAMLYSSALGQTLDLPLDAAAYEAHLKGLIANSNFQKKTASNAGATADDFAQSQ